MPPSNLNRTHSAISGFDKRVIDLKLDHHNPGCYFFNFNSSYVCKENLLTSEEQRLHGSEWLLLTFRLYHKF